MSRKFGIYAVIAIAVVISLILGTGFYTYQRIPPVSAQVDSKRQVTVLIENPPNGRYYPADAAIPITFIAYGEKAIASLEYWVDGKLAATKTPEKSLNPKLVLQIWKWMPIAQGKHSVTIRARDVDGNMGTSNVLHIVASKPAGFDLLYTAKTGDTWDDLQKFCNTSRKAIARNNPGLDTKQPVQVGQKIRIPCDSPIPSVQASNGSTPPSTGAEAPPASSAAPNKLGIWVAQNLSGPHTPPEAPALTAGLNGCTAHLRVQDNSKGEAGFFVYRSADSGFERIATLGAGSNPSFSYDDTVKQAGLMQYFVSSFNAAGENQSNIVPVQVAAGACGLAPVSNPKLQFSNGVFTVPANLQLAYMYVSLDKGPWQRLPEGNQYFTPVAGDVDPQSYLAPLLQADPGARSADIEAWGWTKGDQITDLGPLHINIENTTLDYCSLPGKQCIGDIEGLSWTNKDGVVDSSQSASDLPILFKYEANDPGVPAVMVQISTLPIPQDLQMQSPYLVDEYLVNADQGAGYIAGQFPILFSSLNKPTPSHPFNAVQNLVNHNLAGNVLPGLSPSDNDLFHLLRQNGVGSFLQSGLLAPVYYIRVLPWDLNKPAGKASNTIAITYKPLPPSTPPVFTAQQPPIYDIRILDFAPEQQIDPLLYGCVVVTHVDEAVYQQWIQDINNYAQDSLDMAALGALNEWMAKIQVARTTGTPICPPLDILGPSSPGSPWDIFTGIWDSLVSAWNWVKNEVVDIVASAINAVTAGLCESQTCKDLLMTGLNVAITAFTGLPPSFPSATDMVNSGLDYAVQMALDEAGVTCTGSCLDNIKSTYSTIESMIAEQDSQPACNNLTANMQYQKKAMCLPPGITVKPIAGASYVPATVELQVTRNAEMIVYSAQQFNYSVTLTVDVTHPALGSTPFLWAYNNEVADDGNDYVFHVILPAPIPAAGAPYQPVSLPLPADLPSGSAPYTLPVSLKDISNFTYAPFAGPQIREVYGGRDTYQMSPYLLAEASSLFLTSPGATYTVHAQLACTDRKLNTRVACPTSDATQDTRQFIPAPVLQGVIVP